MRKRIQSIIKKNHNSIVELRRYLHTYPELSGQEYNTQRRMLTELKALGIPCRPMANTGVYGEIVGGKPGKTIAIRADMDGLELQDQLETDYQSQNTNVCHACGHDGHMAMLVGVAKVLMELRQSLAGTFRLLFQPSEERFPGGAAAMLKEGALDGADAVIGAHLWQSLQAGTVGISYGRLMAEPDEFTLFVQGKGGHGSMPHQTVDAGLVAAQIVVALHTIVSRNVAPLEQAVVSIGQIHAGEAFNIIPDTAVIKGTVRSFDRSVRDLIFERMEHIVAGICRSYGANYKIDKQLGYPPLINHPDYAKVFEGISQEVVGRDKTLSISPVMGGEDFSYYLEKVPGAFLFIGSGNQEKGIVYPQHHPKFDIDEEVLLHGVEIMSLTAIHLAQQEN